MNGLVNAFQLEENLGGLYEDYLERSIRRVKTITTMSEAPGTEKLLEIQIMLHSDVLDFFDE